MRNEKLILGGYFSAKLKDHQQKWLPCELEALAITSATNHWGPLILQSRHQSQILTDSRPCVQAFDRLSRGEFSNSARVSTFLATLSRYNVKLQHISGAANLPADFLSRAPPQCDEQSCQICKFISECQSAPVCSVTVQDILEGRQSMPLQILCPGKCVNMNVLISDVQAHTYHKASDQAKKQETVLIINPDGLLAVIDTQPFRKSKNLLIIPCHLVHGLCTALHLRLQNPLQLYLCIIVKGWGTCVSEGPVTLRVRRVANHLRPKWSPTTKDHQPPWAQKKNVAVTLIVVGD